MFMTTGNKIFFFFFKRSLSINSVVATLLFFNELQMHCIIVNPKYKISPSMSDLLFAHGAALLGGRFV